MTRELRFTISWTGAQDTEASLTAIGGPNGLAHHSAILRPGSARGRPDCGLCKSGWQIHGVQVSGRNVGVSPRVVAAADAADLDLGHFMDAELADLDDETDA
jgi:hypothetical protein